MNYITRAIELAATHSRSGINGPFGAVIVKNNSVIGEGWNRVVELNDPSAHAEINAIRNACQHIKSPILTDSVLYTSCEPCPMCLSAAFWARIDTIVYACDRIDADKIGFDDNNIYQELQIGNIEKKIKLIQQQQEEGRVVFTNWENNKNKIMY